MENIDLHLLLTEWSTELMLTISDNNSFGIALFSINGDLLFANTAMVSLCNDFNSKSLLHPTFEALNSTDTTDILIFSGYLTIGKFNSINTSIEAKVYRKHGVILISGGINASDLIEHNKTMHDLNLKVTNLQRQLTQEKAELERAMKELKETQQMLIHSEKMNAMGNLVAGVAHELNNPIAFVYSNLFSLEKYIAEIFQSYHEVEELISQNISKELIDKIAKIHEKNEIGYISNDFSDIIKESKIGIERVKEIVEDLRRFSRMDESEIKQIDLVENIRSTVSIANSELSRKSINFELSVPVQLLVNCYPGQLNQAILNVLINAIYAVKVGGQIILSITEDEKNICISVKDNGSGIPEEFKERIFDPFFTTKPVGSGTGLGLSITYKIIHNLHHGSIEVESVLEKETVIKLIIPKNIIG